MGDIYKAQDTRLNRFVAVKVLSGPNSGDPERRRRFIQEAQAASALNHPNIITIHDIVPDGDTQFMVMEYVSGKTLVDLIPKGGLRTPQALKYAVQMTDALSVAHGAGIIHRDLKPANVMVTDSGLVKILDFGLAKLTDRGGLTNQPSDNTRTMADAPLTVEGSILGTVSYMSPEQAQGKRVDARSDVFSFGVVLYEMLTGVRAFAGENALSTLSAILRDEAKPFNEVAPDVPPKIEAVVQRCLRKNPDDRWQSMQDVRMALGALKHESESGQLYKPQIPPAATVAKAGPSKAIMAIAIGLVVLIGGGIGTRELMKRRHQREEAMAQAAAAAAAQDATPAAAPEPEPAPPTPPPAPTDVALTNDNIIEMVDAKVATSVILSQIRSSKTDFNLSAPEVIRLTKAGVPASLIEVMRNPKAPPPVRTAATKAPAPAPPPPVATPVVTPAAAPVAVVPVTPTPAPAPAPPPVAPAKVPTEKVVVVTVTDGLPIPMVLTADIPADAEEGLPLRFTTATDFRASDVVVIPRGSVVTGAIVESAGKKKFLGIGGAKMTFQVTQVDAVNGQKLKLRAAPVRRADGPTVRPVDTGNQKHSKEVAAAAGTQYIAYSEGEQNISVHK